LLSEYHNGSIEIVLDDYKDKVHNNQEDGQAIDDTTDRLAPILSMNDYDGKVAKQ